MNILTKKAPLALALAVLTVAAALAQQPHVYINPGHGGHDSGDRNVVVYPFRQGDTCGFWESNSNLKKGLALKQILENKGYITSISRVSNTTEDDLALSTIVALCNASGADVFYAIHSNATGTTNRSNFPLGLYRGYTGQPVVAGSDVLTADLGEYLIKNQSTVWTSNSYAIYGDWTFYPQWGDKVGLGVLRGNQAVSMLSEGSFHDYVPEAYRLLSDDYCWVEAWNFSLGADKYFDRLDSFDQGIVTGNIRDDRIQRDVEHEGRYIIFGDDQLLPIHNAVVRLLTPDSAVVATAVTDTLRNGIYLLKYVEPGDYILEASEARHFTQYKNITVTANAPTYQNFYLKRVRDTPPRVVDYAPRWAEGDPDVKCSQVIELDFNWDMDTATTQAAFSLVPTVAGTFRWEDSGYRLLFTPDDAFDVNTLYTLTLRRSASHAGGTPMDEDFVMRFYTQGRNHLNKLAMFPDEGELVHYKTPLVEFRTDSMLDSKDLFNKLRVRDANDTELAWNKRSIRNNKKGDDYGFIRIPLVKDLAVGGQYKVELDANIADTAGIHLPEPWTFRFTAVDAGVVKPGMVTVLDFEDPDAFAVTDSAYCPAMTLTASTERLFGSKSLLLKYEMGPDGEAVVSHTGDITVRFHRGDTLGIHICGDMSYNRLYALMQDAADASAPPVRIDLGEVTYHGWRYVTAPIEADGSFYLAGFALRRGHPVMGREGSTLKLDEALRAAYSGLATPHSAGVKVTCSGDYVVASADGFVRGLELLDVNGRTVAAAGANFLNVSALPAGVYFVRVLAGDRVTTHKVLVTHR